MFDLIDDLKKTRHGRIALVIAILVGSALLIAFGTWLAIAMTGLPAITAFDWFGAIFCGIMLGAMILLVLVLLYYAFERLYKWITEVD